jgi:dipeptidyl aminopeptidase/acylaminoacyl peptidase
MRKFAVLLLIFLAPGAWSEELPYTYFGHLPLVDQPTVSPDGKQVASILNGEDGPTIVVSSFGSTELNAIVRLKYGSDRIEWIDWANNERLLISVSETSGPGAQRFRIARLYQVGLDGTGMKQIRRKPTRPVPDWVQRIDTDSILSMLPNDPDHILMQIWDERDNAFAVFKVNIKKNQFKKEFANTYDVNGWWSDDKGNVVFGRGYNPNTDEITFWFRPNGKGEWQSMHTRKAYEGETFAPIFVASNKAIVLTDYELGRQAVWQYDLQTGEYEEVLFSAEGYDVEGAIMSNDRAALLGVYYFDDFRVDHYFDAAAAQRAEFIKSSFPQFKTTIVSRSLDGKRMIVSLVSDDAPPRYIWVDLEKKVAQSWFSQYPYLDNKPMPNVKPIQFEARDGILLNGYLTMPLESEGARPPLIVFPHGGPDARDYRYFDPFVQFFANRGYAVLQVNFRGSTGFGTEFEIAGYREWGRAMQNDVYDAIDWLIEQDLVDGDRKCIVGASYGGYVSLVAAYQKPRDFRCVVSIAGISDLYRMAMQDSMNPYRKLIISEEVGDPYDSADKELLLEYSAIRHVEAIRAPLLVIHGIEDTRVRIAQTRRFYDRAKKAGVEIEYLELQDGTHFLDGYQTRLAVFEALDSFLKKHL